MFFFDIEDAIFAKNLANSFELPITLQTLGAIFCTLICTFRAIIPNCSIYIENPLASKSSRKNDLSIAPITDFYILANIFLGVI